MATVAIGDVHGERAALDSLLERVLPELGSDDEVVFLGDLIDRGPDSRGVLDRVAALRRDRPGRVSVLLGNHEEWLLRAYRDPTSASWLLGMDGLSTVASYAPEAADALRAALRAAGPRLLSEPVGLPYAELFDRLPPDHLALLEDLVPYRRTGDVLCVHAGVLADVPLADQDPHDLAWGVDGWPEGYAGGGPVVYGHWNDAVVEEGRGRPRVAAGGRTYGIDAVAQGLLLALRFPDLKVFQSDPVGPGD